MNLHLTFLWQVCNERNVRIRSFLGAIAAFLAQTKKKFESSAFRYLAWFSKLKNDTWCLFNRSAMTETSNFNVFLRLLPYFWLKSNRFLDSISVSHFRDFFFVSCKTIDVNLTGQLWQKRQNSPFFRRNCLISNANRTKFWYRVYLVV